MPFVAAFVDDLMFLSRIREAARGEGLEVRGLRTVEDMIEACRPPERARLVLVDLDSVRLPWREAVAALRSGAAPAQIPVVGFFGHVHAERAQEAQAAGCTRVLPRSAFVRELSGLLRRPPTTG